MRYAANKQKSSLFFRFAYPMLKTDFGATQLMSTLLCRETGLLVSKATLRKPQMPTMQNLVYFDVLDAGGVSVSPAH